MLNRINFNYTIYIVETRIKLLKRNVLVKYNFVSIKSLRLK